jgi:hypothetical protein
MAYELLPDIAERIEHDFGTDALGEVRATLEPIVGSGLGDRVIRCVLVLAQGNHELLRHYVHQAVDDYRDVIYWAEYDAARRTHDFSNSFDRAALQ